MKSKTMNSKTPAGIVPAILARTTIINTVRILTVCTAAMLVAGSAALAADPAAGAPGGQERDRAAALREFTGAQTRLVWVQDAGPSACVFSEKPTLRLMGYDTDDGKGERPILPGIGWYAKPQLTADGKRVVFADWADHSINVVNFDGTGRRLIVKDVEEWSNTSVLTDPLSGVAWAYASIMEKRGDQQVFTIRRYQIDHPEVNELIWDKSKVDMFMMNGDGRFASGGGGGAGGNTPQGVFSLPNNYFAQRAGGCQPSMSPDNSLRSWVFTGNHRSIHFCVTTDPRTGKGYTYGVDFTKAPGLTVSGQQEMYHPRWSNNVRFLSLGAPFEQWNYEAEAKIPMAVAEKVELYVGKFTEDMKGIERWVQVTHNTHGDYWADTWIKPAVWPPAWANTSGPTATEADSAATKAEPDRAAQVFVWTTGSDNNQIVDPKTGAIRQCMGLMRDAARYGRNHVMDLTAGAFVPDATAKPWLEAVQAGNAFAVEAVLTPLAVSPSGEGVVLAFADDLETGNIVLSQRGDMLSLRLKGRAGEPLPLVRLPRDRASHVVVSYAPGKLAVFVNGQRVLLGNSTEVAVSSWTAQPVIFGDAVRGGHNWPGLLEGIGLFGREIGQAEARQRFEAQQARSAGRKATVELAIVEAKLTGVCAAADPKGIAPYKRCLSVQQFEVVKTITGKLADKVINVAQWSVLDGRVVPEYLEFKAGETYQLALERWADHPEQESERMISGDFEEQELFYQVRGPAAPAAKAVPVATAPAPAVTWSPVSDQANVRRLTAPVLIRRQDKPTLFSAEADTKLDAAGQDIVFENGSLSEVTITGSLRLGGSGAVTAAAVVNGGARYSSAPAVKLSGGGGQGAAAEAVMAVTDVALVRLGSGYTSAPKVTIAAPEIYGGRQATAVAQFDKASGALTRVDITDPGSGYPRAPRVTIEGGGGSGAEVQATLSVADVFVLHGGTGYTTQPVAVLTGDGEGATVQALLQRTVLRYTDGQGGALLKNTGTINQDGAGILFDWAAPANNGGAPRAVANNGTWEMRNGALIQFGSSTGRALWNEGVINAGTLRLLGGARLAVLKLQNSGTLQLGSGSVIGHAGGSTGDALLANTGQVLVDGGDVQNPVAFGLVHPETTGKRTVENGSPDGAAKAGFTIGDGRTSSVLRVMGGQTEFNNHAGSSLQILPGSTLELLTNDNGSGHPFNNRKAFLTNEGDLLLAGLVQVQGNQDGPTGISNKGRLTIQGAQAGVERLMSSAGPGAYYNAKETSSQLKNLEGGVVQGAGTFTYTNHTGTDHGGYLRLINQGRLSPGGAKPGRLTFANVNVQFAEASGALSIAIAGPKAYSSVEVTGEGASGGRFELDSGKSWLDVVTPAGAVPRGTYRIVTATAVSGTFAALQFNGKVSTAYTVNYLADGIEVVFP